MASKSNSSLEDMTEPPEPNSRVPKALEKTQLCKHWLKGFCRFGWKCGYAHQEGELVPRPNLFKTRLCLKFFCGNCTAENCKYAHGSPELRKPNQDEKSAPIQPGRVPLPPGPVPNDEESGSQPKPSAVARGFVSQATETSAEKPMLQNPSELMKVLQAAKAQRIQDASADANADMHVSQFLSETAATFEDSSNDSRNAAGLDNGVRWPAGYPSGGKVASRQCLAAVQTQSSLPGGWEGQRYNNSCYSTQSSLPNYSQYGVASVASLPDFGENAGRMHSEALTLSSLPDPDLFDDVHNDDYASYEYSPQELAWLRRQKAMKQQQQQQQLQRYQQHQPHQHQQYQQHQQQHQQQQEQQQHQQQQRLMEQYQQQQKQVETSIELLQLQRQRQRQQLLQQQQQQQQALQQHHQQRMMAQMEMEHFRPADLGEELMQRQQRAQQEEKRIAHMQAAAVGGGCRTATGHSTEHGGKSPSRFSSNRSEMDESVKIQLKQAMDLLMSDRPRVEVLPGEEVSGVLFRC